MNKTYIKGIRPAEAKRRKTSQACRARFNILMTELSHQPADKQPAPTDLQAKSLENQALQVDMARTRTALATERTLLAWIRTALTLVAFGFTMAKYIHGLVKQARIQGVQAYDIDSPHNLGLVMMAMGLLGLIGGTISYCRSSKKLYPTASFVSTPFITAVLLSIMTVFLMVLMVLKDVP